MQNGAGAHKIGGQASSCLIIDSWGLPITARARDHDIAIAGDFVDKKPTSDPLSLNVSSFPSVAKFRLD